MSEPVAKRKPHKRLTAEQVKQGWLLGDYTASGYLFHLIGALRRDGWQLQIKDVDRFCEQWEISRASFYRAKAKLILQGRIGEEIQGKLKLWINHSPEVIPTGGSSSRASLNIETENLTSETSNLNIETENLTSEIAIAPQPASNGHPSDSTDLSSDPLPDLSHSHPPANAHTPERNELLRNGKPIELFKEWLLRRAEELPKKPALLSRWVNKQAMEEDIQEEFLNYQKALERINVPPPDDPPQNSQPEPQEMTQQERLGKYLALWQTPILRSRVTAQIKGHPEWGLAIADAGPTLAPAQEVAELCP